MACMSPQKWQDYSLHHSIDPTDRELMTEKINHWVDAYLKECVSAIRTLQRMMTTASPSTELDGKNGHEIPKLSTLSKRWNQMKNLCEHVLNDSNRTMDGSDRD